MQPLPDLVTLRALSSRRLGIRQLWRCPWRDTLHRTREDARRGTNVVMTRYEFERLREEAHAAAA